MDSTIRRIRPFAFDGAIPASKSIMNRLATIQTFADDRFRIVGTSDADDVKRMRAGVVALRQGRVIDCGAGGTVVRFMALRASRIPGRHRLTGSPRLFARPQEPLIEMLAQLHVRATLEPSASPALTIEGDGWQAPGAPLVIDGSRSSQFASAVVLSAWNLPFPLTIHLSGEHVSAAYWELTRRLVQRAGMRLEAMDPRTIRIPVQQSVQRGDYDAEPDCSAAFAIAGLAAIAGEARIHDFPTSDLQPDQIFPTLLQSMGVPLARVGTALMIRQTSHLCGIDVDLRNTPDLFPVLAILCAVAEGRSHLYGAPHLQDKESNRIAKIAELLRAIGRQHECHPDGITIEQGWDVPSAEPVVFDCDQDHRLVMAATMAQHAGYALELRGTDAITKSFPAFPLFE